MHMSTGQLKKTHDSWTKKTGHLSFPHSSHRLCLGCLSQLFECGWLGHIGKVIQQMMAGQNVQRRVAQHVSRRHHRRRHSGYESARYQVFACQEEFADGRADARQGVGEALGSLAEAVACESLEVVVHRQWSGDVETCDSTFQLREVFEQQVFEFGLQLLLGILVGLGAPLRVSASQRFIELFVRLWCCLRHDEAGSGAGVQMRVGRVTRRKEGNEAKAVFD
mmetsp:Transcript_40692/g.116010  ORF Transcript_40692/g.116010 Transcript_40692/m.116010 type:complete len:222 (-) Transcript_40692:819-1484(-)